MLPALKVNSLLKSRYRIIEPIGQGGMGSIYKAEDERLEGRFCAIKEIQIDVNSSPEQQKQAREQFHREASILARLDHTNLPKVSDFFNEGTRDYLVMDYVPGVDLRTEIEEAKAKGVFIPEAKALNWISQLCDAVGYLHSQTPPIVHRDIKPANIKLTPEGVIKLVDFGLVKVMIPDSERTITVVQGRGTAHYTPLEQYGGDTGHTEPRTDLYSIGATLYHLLTNEPPIEAKSRFLDPKTMISPRQINQSIGVRTEQAIMWALRMHPEERPVNIDALREALFSTGPLDSWVNRNYRESELFIAPVNRVLLLVSALLIIISIIATAFSPVIP